jgi:dTDP-4-dehydrorhamnose reductase
MKVAIFGASGLLGKELTRTWTGDEILAPTSREVDIRNADQVEAWTQKQHPERIVLAAAFTNVDGCETDQELAFAVNRDAAATVARAARRIDAKLLFLSSDYVFDGKKTSPYEADDARNPQSIYGQTKAEAEVRLLEIMSDCCIVRTSWLFGTNGKCFPDTILKLAASRPSLDVVSDQRGSPTYAVDLAAAIIQLCRQSVQGIIHATNGGDCTWFDFAAETLQAAGSYTEVRPVSSLQMARPAPRPAYSVLSPASLQRVGIEMPSWQDALRRYLKERER